MEAKQTPLIELLERVPQNARCRVDEPDGMGSVFIPVGKLCHEAAAELRRLHAENDRLREALKKLEFYSDGTIRRYPDESEVEAALRQEQPK